jgi:putative oxidoreductase
MKPVRTVARACLAAIFVSGGLDAVVNPDRLVPGAKSVTDRLAPTLDAVGLPTDTRTLVRLNGAVQVAGGVLLATNTAPRPAALALIGSLVPTTLAGHDFWAKEDPAEKVGHRIQFLKNLGLIGGLLLAAVDTAGRPGLTWQAGHLAGHAQDSLNRAAHRTARETKRAARSTSREARRAMHTTSREARRAARDARRTARTAVRTTKQTAGTLLPG